MERILDWNKYLKKATDTVSEGIVMLKMIIMLFLLMKTLRSLFSEESS